MRLIDADKLIEDFKNELEKVDFEKLSDNDKLVISTSAIALKDFVKRQPTAYDIDKVVEALLQCTACSGHKDHEKQCGGCAGCIECKLEDAYYNAIDIVKGQIK